MNNDMLDLITSRRSVRNFKNKTPDTTLIEKVVTAGMFAPTGKNLQSPIILAITNKKIRDDLSNLCANLRGINSDPFYGAPVVLVVLAKKSVPTFVYDGSVVMENLLLEAHSLGLGACWIHHAKQMFETEYGKNLLKSLGINEEYEGIGNCILGYPNTTPSNKVERKQNYVYFVD